MTAAAPAASADSPGLITRLRAELRPQFAIAVIMADPVDPVMGGLAVQGARLRAGRGADGQVQRAPSAVG